MKKFLCEILFWTLGSIFILGSGWVINPYRFAGFLPTDISNLIVWCDVNDTGNITLNGSDISQCADKSGNGNDIDQTTAANQPVYDSADTDFNNNGSLSCDGTNYYMTTAAFSSALSQPNSIIVVAKLNSVVGTGYLFDGIVTTSRQGLFHSDSTTDTFAMTAPTDLVSSNANDVNTHVLAALFNTTSSDLYIDGGAADVSGNVGSHTMTGLTLCARFSLGTRKDVKITEITVYDKLLSTTELNALGSSLATKHGTAWTDIS